ncbi:MAG: hypothetical protein HY362_02365 [Candidatus Aenigmarchaeota archaeon]|nr:hypothetical protein [Candidatus Aenigmarchaeota archaeon]
MSKYNTPKTFKPWYGSFILTDAINKRLSKEEAALGVLRDHLKAISFDIERQKAIIEGYERFEEYVDQLKRRGESQKTLDSIINPPKDKKSYLLFKLFYRAAKKDLKTKGKITENTLNIIKKRFK